MKIQQAKLLKAFHKVGLNCFGPKCNIGPNCDCGVVWAVWTKVVWTKAVWTRAVWTWTVWTKMV